MSLALNPTLAVPAGPDRRFLDPRRLGADLDALRGEHAEDGAFRRAAVERFRAALDEGRREILADFAEDHGGLRCAGRLAALEDELIRALHAYVLRHVHPPAPTAAAASRSGAAPGAGGWTWRST